MTNSSAPIEYFKKESKDLLRLVKAQKAEALARVRRVLNDADEVTLMRAQHVVAVEYGFPKWEHLTKASPAELYHAITKRKIQQLNANGTPLGIFFRGTGEMPPSPDHAAMADMFDKMTMEEQRRYLDEDARAMGLFR